MKFNKSILFIIILTILIAGFAALSVFGLIHPAVISGKVILEDVTSQFTFISNCSQIQLRENYASSEEDSRKAIDYLNEIRKQNGKNSISFDSRLFHLALARAQDMRENSYLDHTNPTTGACPDNMKSAYGLNSSEFVAEDALGSPVYSEGECTRIEIRSMTEAIDAWMNSRGHRYNLLYEGHVAGAVGCYKNICAFLGLNHDKFGAGCYTAAEGVAFWDSAGLQSGETNVIG